MRIAGGAAALIGILLAVPASSPILGALAAPNGPFSIDGIAVPAAALSDGDSSLVDDGMRSLGISGVPDRVGCRSDIGRGPVLPKEHPGIHGTDPVLPAGLRAEHVLGPPPGRGGTGMAVGPCRETPAGLADRLTRAGWSCLATGSGNGRILVGRITHGKETRIVILEEGRGRFLFLRRTDE